MERRIIKDGKKEKIREILESVFCCGRDWVENNYDIKYHQKTIKKTFNKILKLYNEK